MTHLASNQEEISDSSLIMSKCRNMHDAMYIDNATTVEDVCHYFDEEFYH